MKTLSIQGSGTSPTVLEQIKEYLLEQDLELDPQIKEDWLDALRSGKFKQGRVVLRTNDDRYCCLGVLAEIHPDFTYLGNEGDLEYGLNKYKYCYGMISSAFLDNEFMHAEVQSALTQMNDFGFTFADIADVIEECL